MIITCTYSYVELISLLLTQKQLMNSFTGCLHSIKAWRKGYRIKKRIWKTTREIYWCGWLCDFSDL